MRILDTRGDRIFNNVVLFIVLTIMFIIMYPLAFVLSASFSDPDAVSSGRMVLWPVSVTLEGYRRVFRYKAILIGYRNTVFYTVAGTSVNLALTLSAGYALSKRRLPGCNLLLFIFTFTMYFGGGMIPTYLLVRSLRLLDTWFVLIITGALNVYNMIIARTFFKNGVPSDLEDAAMIDGCSTFRAFFSIVLPLSKALMGVMTLYYAVGHWNSYFAALIYITDRNKVTLQLVLREILVISQMNKDMLVDEEFNQLQEKIANIIKYAVIVVSSFPILCVYPFLQKYFDKGVMLGSLKG